MLETPEELGALRRPDPHSANAPPQVGETDELILLRGRCELLERENAELRRRAAKGSEMLDAASNFLEAYGRKYRNFAGGGMRSTAILFREVELMWAIHNDFRTLTENESRPPSRTPSGAKAR